MSQNFRLKNNSLFIVAEAVGGFFNADQLRTVALVSESESAVLKVTEDGAIGFMVEESRIPEIGEQFRESGIILKHYRSTQTPLARACLGELCPKHEQDALGHSIEVASSLQKAFPDGAPFIRIGMNGCAQNCLASGTDDIHIVGESTGYKIQIGGKASEIPQLAQYLAENVQSQELGTYLEHILAVYVREYQAGESLHDVIERTGLAIFELGTPSQDEGEISSTESASDLINAEANDLDSDTLLSDSVTALAEEDNLFLDTDLESLGQNDLSVEGDATMQLLAMDGSDDLQGDLLGETNLLDETNLLGETDLLDSANSEDLSEETQKHEQRADSEPLDTLDSSELSNSILDPADLDDGLMDLGSMDASVLADLTMNPLADNEADQTGPVDAVGDGTSQEELLDDEISMGTADATEDDVSRVTQAMRSEAAIEQSIGNSAASATAGESLSEVNDLDIENQAPVQADPFDLSASDSPLSQGDHEEQSILPDIPESFLALQEAAANNDALQVKLIEDIVSIRTPDAVMLNLPVQSLNAGLRIVLNLGQLPFETYIRDEKIIIRYGQTSVALPLEAIAPSKISSGETDHDEALMPDAA